mmetsp:Transcript_82614/g.137828  ORF Transcript_82614/g.137828 Transcript_82614/m.137828 type:complete len:218 (+) Transcript_82614:2594-3247(+)
MRYLRCFKRAPRSSCNWLLTPAACAIGVEVRARFREAERSVCFLALLVRNELTDRPSGSSAKSASERVRLRPRANLPPTICLFSASCMSLVFLRLLALDVFTAPTSLLSLIFSLIAFTAILLTESTWKTSFLFDCSTASSSRRCSSSSSSSFSFSSISGSIQSATFMPSTISGIWSYFQSSSAKSHFSRRSIWLRPFMSSTSNIISRYFFSIFNFSL